MEGVLGSDIEALDDEDARRLIELRMMLGYVQTSVDNDRFSEGKGAGRTMSFWEDSDMVLDGFLDTVLEQLDADHEATREALYGTPSPE